MFANLYTQLLKTHIQHPFTLSSPYLIIRHVFQRDLAAFYVASSTLEYPPRAPPWRVFLGGVQ
jgi:hypothetical protein